jgi:hypothetical protein
MTDRIKLLVRLLADTDGLIAEIEAGLDQMPPTEAERMRLVDAEMKMIRDQIESALKKLRAK